MCASVCLGTCSKFGLHSLHSGWWEVLKSFSGNETKSLFIVYSICIVVSCSALNCCLFNNILTVVLQQSWIDFNLRCSMSHWVAVGNNYRWHKRHYIKWNQIAVTNLLDEGCQWQQVRNQTHHVLLAASYR